MKIYFYNKFFILHEKRRVVPFSIASNHFEYSPILPICLTFNKCWNFEMLWQISKTFEIGSNWSQSFLMGSFKQFYSIWYAFNNIRRTLHSLDNANVIFYFVDKREKGERKRQKRLKSFQRERQKFARFQLNGLTHHKRVHVYFDFE